MKLPQTGDPGEKWYVGVRAQNKLAELGLTEADVLESLDVARADAVLCTDLDAPGAPGYIFWSRVNRYFRERLALRGWSWNNRDSVLRAIHPERDFAISAMSGDGQIGIENGRVRTRNPKGSAVAAMVRYNYATYGGPRNQDPLPGMSENNPVFESDMLPTWILLYKWTHEGIVSELSFPSDMMGSTVNKWRRHIILPELRYPDGGSVQNPDLYNNDPDTTAIVVPVERLAG
jgi:hypothetical protein